MAIPQNYRVSRRRTYRVHVQASLILVLLLLIGAFRYDMFWSTGQAVIAVQPEVAPELIGGMEALQARVVYPEAAWAKGLEGRVFVDFVVGVDGRVTDAHVVRGVDGRLDQAALRAVSASRFKPGRRSGRPIPVKMTVPIVFKQ